MTDAPSNYRMIGKKYKILYLGKHIYSSDRVENNWKKMRKRISFMLNFGGISKQFRNKE